MARNTSPCNGHALHTVNNRSEHTGQPTQTVSFTSSEATAELPGTGSINYRLMMPFACTFLKTANIDLIIEDEWDEVALKCSIESFISFFKKDLYHLSAHQYILTMVNHAMWNIMLVLYVYNRFINLLFGVFPFSASSCDHQLKILGVGGK